MDNLNRGVKMKFNTTFFKRAILLTLGSVATGSVFGFAGPEMAESNLGRLWIGAALITIGYFYLLAEEAWIKKED